MNTVTVIGKNKPQNPRDLMINLFDQGIDIGQIISVYLIYCDGKDREVPEDEYQALLLHQLLFAKRVYSQEKQLL